MAFWLSEILWYYFHPPGLSSASGVHIGFYWCCLWDKIRFLQANCWVPLNGNGAWWDSPTSAFCLLYYLWPGEKTLLLQAQKDFLYRATCYKLSSSFPCIVSVSVGRRGTLSSWGQRGFLDQAPAIAGFLLPALLTCSVPLSGKRESQDRQGRLMFPLAACLWQGSQLITITSVASVYLMLSEGLPF